ncbi:MAG: ABC transporter substrate-binding protein [Solirubrobacteraceae bacterium]
MLNAQPPAQRFGRRARQLTTCGAVAATSLALAACGGSGGPSKAGGAGEASTGIRGVYGSLPAEGARKPGGTLTISQLSGTVPDYIFPVVPANKATVYTIDEFMTTFILPLYLGPEGAEQKIDKSLSLAEEPTYSNGDKTVTIKLKEGFKWSNGEPVTAEDVVFDIEMMKQAVEESPANLSEFSKGEFPETIETVEDPSTYTVVMKLTRTYNPAYFMNNELGTEKVFPLPAKAWNVASANGPHLNWREPANREKIYDYLHTAGGKVAEFSTNPLWKVADGPFELATFNATNSSYTLVDNPDYGGSPKPALAEIKRETYTGLTPQLNALRTGSLEVDLLDFSQLGDVKSLQSEGYTVYGYPNLGYYGAIFNFQDTTNHFNKIVAQRYFRGALAQLENQPAYVKGLYKEAAVPAYGPVPSLPPTPYTPSVATKTPYPYNPKAAVQTLEKHGWKVVPGGQSTCEKAGSGPEECGQGIPAGTPIKFSWYHIPTSEVAAISLESEAFASEAEKQAGIDIELHEKAFNYLTESFDNANPEDAKNVNSWGVDNFGGFTLDYYPTTNTIFNSTGSFNFGGYRSAEANKLIKASVNGTNTAAVKSESAYLTEDVPDLFFPNQDKIYAVSNRVGGPASSFLALTQYIPLYQFWYLKK